MNNRQQQITILCVTSFLVGDFMCTVRANRIIKCNNKQAELQTEVLQMKVNTLVGLINDVATESTSMEDLVAKFNAEKDFINLIDKSF